MYTPKYLNIFTQGKVEPVAEVMLAQVTSNREPKCRQQYCFMFIDIPNNSNSRSHILNSLCSSISDDESNMTSSAYKILKLYIPLVR
jgi:hypothetical protein